MKAKRFFNEALASHRKGDFKRAKKFYEQTLKVEPKHASARLYLALILQEKGLPQEAMAHASMAMADAKAPDAAMLVNYGVIMKNAGQLDRAARAYEKALAISPGHPGANTNLATLYMVKGDLDRAEAIFLELTQSLEETAPWFNLARIALAREDWPLAERYLQKAIDIDPVHPEINCFSAKIAIAHKEDEQAYGFLKKLLGRNPAHFEGWALLQKIDKKIMEPVFLECLSETLVKKKIQDPSVLIIAVSLCRSNLVWEFLPRLESMLSAALQKPFRILPPSTAVFSMLAANISQKAHLKVASASWRHQKTPLSRPLVSPRQPGRKINVAFLSSDLRGHAMGYITAGLFENLPRENISWWAYNNSFHDESRTRNRLRYAFDRFINVAKLNDRQLVQKIRSDGIDVLIDLNGVTRDSRVFVMAWRPAPLQVTWLGMPGSVGAGKDIDYLIADPWVVGEDNFEGFSEHILQLPYTYFPNDHIRPDLALAGTRPDHDLPGDAFVFCCFNQYYKFSPDTFALWSQMMQQVPNGVLWLLEPETKAIEKQLEKCGIDIGRVVLARHEPNHDRHIARLYHADLVLDTRPYNAHTTAADALRAGTPVLTLPGKTFASRVAASILDTAGLSQWIVNTQKQYVNNAVSFASKPRSEISAAKKQVLDAYWQSPLVDNKALGKIIEALCLGIYDRAARGEPLQDLRLTKDLHLEVLPFSRKTPLQAGPASSNETSTEGQSLRYGALARVAPYAAKAGIESKDPAAGKIKTIIVLGSYSSGTTAVAGYLAKLGAFTSPPHQLTKDPKTPDAYESKAFRDTLVGLVDELTLTKKRDAPSAFSEWFSGWVAAQKALALEKGCSHVLLKHPLAAFFIDDIQRACQPVFLVVTRQLEAIEKSRLRRGWHPVFGRQGAKVIYNTIFDALIESGISAMIVDYESFRDDPAMGGRLALWAGMDPAPDILAAARKWVF